jgi:hypothetical protein
MSMWFRPAAIMSSAAFFASVVDVVSVLKSTGHEPVAVGKLLSFLALVILTSRTLRIHDKQAPSTSGVIYLYQHQ